MHKFISLIALSATVFFNSAVYSIAKNNPSTGFTDLRPDRSDVVVSTPTNNNNEKQKYSSAFMRFWEDLTGDALEDLCKSAELDLSKGAYLPEDVLGIKAGIGRYMRRFPNYQIALVDEITFKLSAGYNPSIAEISNTVTGGVLNLKFNGSVEGKSQVVRPLENDSYCKELKTLAKLYQLKSVWPPTVKRINNMRVGEIWKLPLKFEFTAGVGLNATVSEGVKISLSAESKRNFNPSVTLYKMSSDKLRLRLRINRVRAKSLSVGVSAVEIPVEYLAVWNTENFLSKLVNKTVAKEINETLAARLSFTKTKFSGKKLLLEFICDPNNPEQVALLSKFLRGNFGILQRFVEIGLDFENFAETEDVSIASQDLTQVNQNTSANLNSISSYAGTHYYDGNSTNLNWQVPVIYKQEHLKERTNSVYHSTTKDENLNVYKYRDKKQSKMLNLPVLGSTGNHSKQKTTYVVEKDYKDGSSKQPVIMYTQFDGLVRGTGNTAENILDEVNDIVKYVGTKGDGINTSNTLVGEVIFPEKIINEDGKTVEASTFYKSVVTSFNLMINENGVQDIIYAPANVILKAFFNLLDGYDKRIFKKSKDLFVIDVDGKVRYDKKAALRLFRFSGPRPLNVMRRLAAKATKLIADFLELRNAATDNRQSEKLSEMLSGKSNSGLSASDMLKVVVQMIDPSDVSASFEMNSRNKKAGKSEYQTQMFNHKGVNFSETLSEVEEAENRFSDPSVLTD